MRVLVVEDSDEDFLLIQRELSSFRPPLPVVARACDLREAGAMLASTVFDVMLLNTHLPDADVDQVLKKLSGDFGPMAVVLMSGIPTQDLVSIALDVGIEGAIAKDHIPFPAALESCLLQALARKQREMARNAAFEALREQVSELTQKVNELCVKLAKAEGIQEGQDRMVKMSKGQLAAWGGFLMAVASVVTALLA